VVSEAYERFRDNGDGKNSQVYPALARAPEHLFGVCVVSTRGEVYAVGDAESEFTIMSVSKPFVFAWLCRTLEPDRARQELGVNSTGLPFNSPEAIERGPNGKTNPMVNPGAIATTSLIPGANFDEKWRSILDCLSKFAGRTLSINQEVFKSASETNIRNRQLAAMLHERGRLGCDPAEAVDLYTRQCSLNVTAIDLATMGATLADGGVNPVSGERVVDATICQYVLAVMATSGLYETSGDWLYDIGLPR
jgi:glutaminase